MSDEKLSNDDKNAILNEIFVDDPNTVKVLDQTQLRELEYHIQKSISLKSLLQLSQSNSFSLTIDIGSSSEKAGKATVCINKNTNFQKEMGEIITNTLRLLSTSAELELKKCFVDTYGEPNVKEEAV